jgi:hypothetical protein
MPARRVHTGDAYEEVWRETIMALKGKPEGPALPAVYVPSDCGVHPQTVRQQLKRLEKVGMIEVVTRRSGLATRVRLTRPPPETLVPEEWTEGDPPPLL